MLTPQTTSPGSESVRLHLRWLVLIYAIVPFSVALIVLDHFVWGGFLASRLPRSPQELAWFSFFFVLPHIVASSVILCDRGYIEHYKSRLGIGIASAAVIAFALPFFAPLMWLLLLNGLLTIYHVLAQQLGLAASMARTRGSVVNIWKALGLSAGVIVYYLFYFSEKIPDGRGVMLSQIAWCLLFLFFILTVWIFSRVPHLYARWYGGLNFLMIFGALIAVRSQYFFFAVLAPRVVHDLTAFSFYVVHDVNRNREGKQNFILSLTRKIPVLKSTPVLFATPLVAIALAALIHAFAAISFVNFITLFHYWTEGFTWKKGTPHRRYVSLASSYP